jgi:putative transposase
MIVLEYKVKGKQHQYNAIDDAIRTTQFDKIAIAVAPHYTSQKCSNCGVILKKSLSTRTHKCSCGCELHRDTNAAINILNLAKARGGHPQSNATGVEASTLLGANLVEQVLTMNVESPFL